MLLEWAVGYAAGKAADRVFSLLQRDPLSKDIDSVLENWRLSLPEPHTLAASEALFPTHLAESQLEDRPCLIALRERLRSNHLPSESDWLDALIEQWRFVRESVEGAQCFFQIPEDTARAHMQDLAARIFRQTTQHARLFNPEVMSLLKGISASLAELRAGLGSGGDGPPSMADIFIRWTHVKYEVDGAYRDAMAQGTAFGAQLEIVREEDALFQQLRAFIENNVPQPAVVAALLDRFRRLRPIDGDWDDLRNRLLSAIMAAEKDAGPVG